VLCRESGGRERVGGEAMSQSIIERERERERRGRAGRESISIRDQKVFIVIRY
jgi:hypothetical protein